MHEEEKRVARGEEDIKDEEIIRTNKKHLLKKEIMKRTKVERFHSI